MPLSMSSSISRWQILCFFACSFCITLAYSSAEQPPLLACSVLSLEPFGCFRFVILSFKTNALSTSKFSFKIRGTGICFLLISSRRSFSVSESSCTLAL
uniref:Putative secreted protein n=1 Tax=Ixodes ricinus TaxID=34613 RepID=A0A147BBX5_IXORI